MGKVHGKLRDKFVKDFGGYIFILPWVIGFTTLTLIPFVCLLFFSFTNYDLLGSPRFVGFENFKTIFTADEKFYTSLAVTFKYVFTAIPLRLIVALMIAMLLNQKRKSVGIYRTIFYIPSIIGGSIAVSVMWARLFSRDGALNSALALLLGTKPDISWVGDPRTALGSLVLLALWQFGSPMIIFLAGLKNIPSSLYEAADVDGANSFQKFKKVTIPLLTPIIFFNLIMQMIGGFMVFTQGLVITQGGPLDKTLFYQIYVYRQGFEMFKMGYASALSCIMLGIIVVFTALVFKSSSSWVYYDAKEE
jgi:multiple sugar transport system permease protein